MGGLTSAIAATVIAQNEAKIGKFLEGPVP
jgi:hypothetical protein